MILSTELLTNQEIVNHHLQGFSYREQKNKYFQKVWKNQLIKNQLVATELKRLGLIFNSQGIEITLLKGFALMGDIYPDWGTRFASDVDLLIHKGDENKCLKILQDEGFQLKYEKKWLGNDFKKILSFKTDLLEITIELHTKLFWHLEKYHYDTVLSRYFTHFKTLNFEDQLIHLCGHLGFQHTFLKMFWLFDIQKYVNKYEKHIHWPLFWSKAKEYELYDCCCLCLCLIDQSIKLPRALSAKQKLLLALCHQQFLKAPREHPLRYFIIKFLIKDRIINNLRYIIRRAQFTFNNELKPQDSSLC